MKLARYIFVRIIAIGLLLVVLNELYYYTFWKSDVSKHADTLENLWAADPNSDAIYFGESSNFHELNSKVKKNRISEILDTLVPQYKIATVDNAGLHGGTFLALIKNIPKNHKLKFLVVTMNLRSFGCVWIKSEFETNLSKANCLIKPYPKLWNRFMISLNEYDLKSNEVRNAELQLAFIEEKFYVPNLPFNCIKDWDKAIAWKEWYGVKKLEDQAEIDLACQYIKNFAFQIDPKKNPRIKDFDDIVKWGKEHNCKIVFNLLSENIEEADQLVGKTITGLLKKNRDLLVSRYSKQGAIIVDNLSLVPDSCFMDRNWPTEHYNLLGKKMVAINLAEKVRKLTF